MSPVLVPRVLAARFASFAPSACVAATVALTCVAACSASSGSSFPPAGPTRPSLGDITFRSDVTPVTSVDQAEKGVFIPPFVHCQDPLPGQTGSGPNGQVCTNVAISGCTEAGKSFPAYASCDVVRTQRPYFATPPAKEPDPNDPRLQDASFMAELGWVTQQIQASACSCCHDSTAYNGQAAEWDISHGKIWLDTLSNSGLALFVGLADSSTLGAYPAADNHGFDRTSTGIPTTDTARMKAFLTTEMAHRGFTQAQASAVAPFGGPIYTNRIAKPTVCTAAEGVGTDGTVTWRNGSARYVYVLGDGTENPGVPPNEDTPDGTLWRLDVLASADALPSGIAYGQTPAGSFQNVPDQAVAPALQTGTRYHFYVYKDVGIPLANCTFVYGGPAPVDAGTPAKADTGSGATTPPAGDAGGSDAANGDAGSGLGKTCLDVTNSTDCPADADYCAEMPGQTSGYCTRKGCKDDASICPSGWTCLDLSAFGAGLPSICEKP